VDRALKIESFRSPLVVKIKHVRKNTRQTVHVDHLIPCLTPHAVDQHVEDSLPELFGERKRPSPTEPSLPPDDSATPDARPEVSRSRTWNAATQSVNRSLDPPDRIYRHRRATGLWYEGEWWPYEDIDGNGDGAAGSAAGGATGGGGGVYEEGE